MAMEFKLPELGENIESGDLVRLMIKPGASIAEGEPVMELETDKAVVEVPSSVTGTIGEIRVKEGDKLRVGQVIFTVENGAGATTSASKRDTSKPDAPEKSATPARAAAASASPAAADAARIDSVKPDSSKPDSSKPAATVAPRVDRRPTSTGSATAGEFKLPELGENIDSGDLVRLMIAPGTSVSEGQPVMELETEKAVVEVPSTVSGVVGDVKVKEGQKVKVGQVIFTLEGGVAAPAEPTRRHEPVEHMSGQHGSAARIPVGHASRRQNRRTGVAARSPSANRQRRQWRSACRCNWAKSQARTTIPLRQRRMCGGWHAKSV